MENYIRHFTAQLASHTAVPAIKVPTWQRLQCPGRMGADDPSRAQPHNGIQFGLEKEEDDDGRYYTELGIIREAGCKSKILGVLVM